MRRYFRNVGVSLTQSLGSFLGFTLNPNETTSGAAFRKRHSGYGWLYRGINALFFWQDDHCYYASVVEKKDCIELLEAYGYEVKPCEHS